MKTKKNLSVVCALLGTLVGAAGQPGIGDCLATCGLTRVLTGPVAADTGDCIGVAWGDYDNDGYIDLFLAKVFGENNALFHNNGNGTFSRITSGSIVTDGGDARGCAWGDYDGDGYLDLFVANTGGINFLYRNNRDGTFTRMTANAVGTIAMDVGRFVQPTWVDYDRDGWLDLFVTAGGTFTNQNNYLYRNSGTNSFVRITTGPQVNDGGRSFGAAWADYDHDGWPDLFVANGYGQTNFFYQNNRDGTFSKITTNEVVTQTGPHFGGGVWGDYDNDGELDLFVISVGGHNFLFRNDSGVFTTVPAAEAGEIVSDSISASAAAWGDYDNDGWLDLFVASEAASTPGVPRNNFLYRNNRNGGFTRIAGGVGLEQGDYFEGCAWGDYDNDGFLDLIVGGALGTPTLLYHNDGNSNHWLTITLSGSASSRSAVGAKVKIKTVIEETVRWQLRQISGDSGGYGQNDLRAHFGLGEATYVERLIVEWPSGTIQEMANVPANQFLAITEPPLLQAPRILPNGSLQFRLVAGTGTASVIQSSSNLVNWTALATTTNTTRTNLVIDVDATNLPRRFYRTVSLP